MRPLRLTPRQREICELFAAGLRGKEVAARLSIEHSTVRAHLRNAYDLNEISSLAELVARFERERQQGGRVSEGEHDSDK